MKPLFDSEQFSFIGCNDDRVWVHCRKCGQDASVELTRSPAGEIILRAKCSSCRNQRDFTLAHTCRSAPAAG
jgi:hypothetical protein